MIELQNENATETQLSTDSSISAPQSASLDLTREDSLGNEVVLQEANTKKKKNKAEKNLETTGTQSGTPIIKVQLPDQAALMVQKALSVLKERKADTKADELLSEFLNSLTQKFLDDQIEKRTPEDYYLEAAAAIPELKAKLIEQAKKALFDKKKGLITSKPKVLQNHSETTIPLSQLGSSQNSSHHSSADSSLKSSRKKEKKMRPGTLTF